MKIVSWNINGVKARRERLLNWLERHSPEVVCLQEIKTDGEHFPYEELGELGYYAEICGQKGYHGVAILAKAPLEVVQIGLEDGEAKQQARLLCARVYGLTVISVYVPNGATLESEKWPYKLAWYQRLRAWLDAHLSPGEPVVLCGDFNVAPLALDIQGDPQTAAAVLVHPQAREALRQIEAWGFVDSLRTMHPEAEIFSWWDYRGRSFPERGGLRIDMVYATAPLVPHFVAAGVDLEEREEIPGWIKPSDHAPAWLEIADTALLEAP